MKITVLHIPGVGPDVAPISTVHDGVTDSRISEDGHLLLTAEPEDSVGHLPSLVALYAPGVWLSANRNTEDSDPLAGSEPDYDCADGCDDSGPVYDPDWDNDPMALAKAIDWRIDRKLAESWQRYCDAMVSGERSDPSAEAKAIDEPIEVTPPINGSPTTRLQHRRMARVHLDAATRAICKAENGDGWSMSTACWINHHELQGIAEALLALSAPEDR